MAKQDEGSAIELAERVLSVLHRGKFTTTYKDAVLLALLNVCLENVSRGGGAPSMVTTRQLAQQVLKLYWRQVEASPLTGTLLSQSGGRAGQKASILEETRKLRTFAEANLGTASLSRVQHGAKEELSRTIDEIEWTLIRYPLPLLQVVNREQLPFLYRMNWEHPASRREVRAYQRGEATGFDNRLLLFPGVGEQLIQLNQLLRLAIQRHWAVEVSKLNRLQEDALDDFLFGAERVALTKLAAPLVELQHGACFYCERSLKSGAHVDHFIPWSRHPSNAIENLVASHGKCNVAKSDHLAAARHVEKWAERLEQRTEALEQLADEALWETNAQATESVARGVYYRLPEAVGLWVSGARFEPLSRSVIRSVFEARATP